jgi:hypothetical protein
MRENPEDCHDSYDDNAADVDDDTDSSKNEMTIIARIYVITLKPVLIIEKCY